MTAFQGSQISVNTTTATELVSGLTGRYQIIIDAGVERLAIGDSSGVTQSTGYAWSGNPLTMDVVLDSTDALYAIATSGEGTFPVSVMVNPR